MELIKNTHVVFTEEPHRYTLLNEDFSSKELSGITAIIKSTICPDLYKDVAEDILKKAAEHGTRCHKLCEQYDNGQLQVIGDNNELADELNNVISDPELYAYRQLVADNDLMVLESEYLVSDNENFASCIDKVVQLNDKEVAIVDLKFTYQYHEEPVTWQTSFYADMLEAQNPKVKVSKLYCIHIHNYPKDGCKAALHELKRVPTEYLEQAKMHHILLQAGFETPFENPYKRKEMELPQTMMENENSLANILSEHKRLDKEKKAIMDEVKKFFAENPGTAKLKGKIVTFSQSLPTTKMVFNMDQFKAENPDLYKKYLNQPQTTAGKTTVSFNK